MDDTNADRSGADHLSKGEIGKDAVQSTVEAAASAVGEVASILTKAVQDVAGAVGGFATEIFEIREAARKAADEQGD
ncbi:hypothetical protein NPS01_16050 [Nocardioides psychrotolerans]|uniref:Uncharacterized protein n=1 Tax=Nocardioides psychrotolerans TaxID=1005945 RepID=A0A1I3EZV8_9ACTN|nr:hypothetical protein [Nocardioides psychrotolerans]GEP37942.1 hypothetical protein NPS01_16050 [Nocardioides psychrotolerans]SFI04071.1 hypothetical protein SAMN05216561_104136 [Nocardioides psychrotolerans]